MRIDLYRSRNEEFIFSHREPNNTVKKTVELAIRSGVEIYGVSLTHEDLSEVQFSDLDLSFCDFSGSCVCRSNFSNSTLHLALFRGCCLRGACFFNTDLSGAKFK